MTMRGRSLYLLLFFFTLAVPALPASGGWSEPTSGVVFDAPTHSLRRIAGFLGAAQLSEPIARDLEWAVIAPGGLRAVAETSSGELVWIEGLDSVVSSTPISPPGLPPYLAKWNSDSTAVRVFSGDCGCFITFATRTPGVPYQSGALQFFDISGGTVLDFFWEDSVTVVTTDQGLSEIDEGESKLLFPSSPDLRFLIDASGKAWAAKGERGELLEVILNPGRDPELKLIATDAEHFGDLAAIASVPGAVYAADRKTRRVYRIRVDSGIIDAMCDVDVEPTRIAPLADGNVWLIRERVQPGEPMFVLDGRATPQVFFVPGGDQQ